MRPLRRAADGRETRRRVRSPCLRPNHCRVRVFCCAGRLLAAALAAVCAAHCVCRGVALPTYAGSCTAQLEGAGIASNGAEGLYDCPAGCSNGGDVYGCHSNNRCGCHRAFNVCFGVCFGKPQIPTPSLFPPPSSCAAARVCLCALLFVFVHSDTLWIQLCAARRCTTG